MARPDEQRQPVSLAPLSPEEALRALLAVKPDDDPTDSTLADEAKTDTSHDTTDEQNVR